MSSSWLILCVGSYWCLSLQEYDDARQKYDDVKKERKRVEKQFRDLKRVHAPLRQKLQENEAIVTKFRDTERVSW